jgi:hypothetical protein
LRWMSLMDESICATAEGEPPAAVAAHPALMQRVEHLTTQREVRLGASGGGLLGRLGGWVASSRFLSGWQHAAKAGLVSGPAS